MELNVLQVEENLKNKTRACTYRYSNYNCHGSDSLYSNISSELNANSGNLAKILV